MKTTLQVLTDPNGEPYGLIVSRDGTHSAHLLDDDCTEIDCLEAQDPESIRAELSALDRTTYTLTPFNAAPVWVHAPQVMPDPDQFVLVRFGDALAIAHASQGRMGGWAIASLDPEEENINSQVIASFEEPITWSLLPQCMDISVGKVFGEFFGIA